MTRPPPAAARRARPTADLEREFFRAYPELAERVRQARTHARAAPTPPGGRGRWLLAVLMLCALAVLVWVAPARGDVAAEDVGAGTLLLGSGDLTRSALLLATEVEIAIAATQARVEVTQRFENRGPAFREGIYLFPLPEGAAIDSLRVDVGGRTIEGRIEPRQHARRSYASARGEGRVASLLEQQRPNLFSLSVANIAPGETISVHIGYLERLRYDAGRFSLRFPLTLTPRFEPGGAALESAPHDNPALDAASITPPPASAGLQRASIRAHIDSGVALASLESLYHTIRTGRDGHRYRVSLRDGSVPADRDFVLRWAPRAGSLPEAVVFGESDGDAAYAALMVLPPAADQMHDTLSREVIFVLDVSGSMAGTAIRQARAALADALRRLRASDSFNVITFAGSARSLFPAALPAHPQTLAHALDYVSALQAGGGTVMAPALAMAFSGNPPLHSVRQVVFITDGAVTNERELFDLIDRDIGEARVFTVGLGSAPNGYFMREAARAGRGTFTYIGALEEAGERMGELFDKLRRPVMTAIRVEWPPGTAAEPMPAAIPDLYAGEPLVVSARLGYASGTVVISGQLAGLPWQAALELDAGQPTPGVAALWARDRITHLERRARRDGSDPSDEIVALAVRHALVSRHTSLVAVERTNTRAPFEPYASTRVLNEIPAGNTMLAYPAGAAGVRLRLLLGVLCLLLAAYLAQGLWPGRAAA